MPIFSRRRFLDITGSVTAASRGAREDGIDSASLARLGSSARQLKKRWRHWAEKGLRRL
jgi:hypothetical protein